MLPKDRISDQKSAGLGLRIVVSLQASKPGYRGGLGNKLLSHLHQVPSKDMWRASCALHMDANVTFGTQFKSI